jgi:NAD(P)-dependent dehydrogenase (short-subunit alcohol dehydrogenase family)
MAYHRKRMSLAPALFTGVAGALAYRAIRPLRPPETLDGKTVLVTGGSRGLGFAIAQEAAARGARIAICGRDPSSLERARAVLADMGAPVAALPCDVTDLAAVQLLVDTVGRALGEVDVLINNAGVIQVGPAEEMTAADYAEAMAANFWGVVHSSLAVVPGMRARGSGWIINIASIGGRISVPHLLPYGASKFAAVGFSKGLRAELAPHGIRVVTVCPGLMRTGSPRNATFRGRHRREYAWFSIADSLPLLSVSAEWAARRILDDAMRGAAEVTFPITMRAASILEVAAPGLTSGVLTLASRLLPRAPRHSSGARAGRESESWLSPSLLTTLGDRAAARYNQIARDER